MSSIELFRRPGYGYLDGPAVAGHGHVSSVQVFLRRSLEDVRSIALDPASRTAATLSQVVWPDAQAPPVFLEVEPGTDPRRVEADAWLRIGDVALRETIEPNARPVFNPSAEWTRRTSLPFVFALWIVRPGVDVRPYGPAFLRARARGRAASDELVRRGARELGLPRPFVAEYLERECFFDPGADLGPSIRAFRDLAAPLGLARADCEPQAVPIDG